MKTMKSLKNKKLYLFSSIALFCFLLSCSKKNNTLNNDITSTIPDEKGLCVDVSQLTLLETGTYENVDSTGGYIEVISNVACSGVSYSFKFFPSIANGEEQKEAFPDGKNISLKTKICIPTPCAPPPPHIPDYQCPPSCSEVLYSMEIISTSEFIVTSDFHQHEGRYIKN